MMALNEIEQYKKCKHPHIIGFYGSAIDSEGNWCLLLEYAAMDDLKSFYEKFEKDNDGCISFDQFSL
jgi:hypothetical protein